ncbi:unnamed protein product [Urochloa humidicola]
MDDLRAAGLDAARKRVTPPTGAAADACAWRSSVPQRLGAGDRRGALPPRPPPPPPPPRRAGAAARDAGEAGHGGRDARRGGVGKAEQVGGGSGAGASAVVARAVPGAGADAKGGNAGVAAAGDGGAAPVLAAAAAVPREGSGGGEAGSKKRAFASSTAAAPRLYPPPKRRMVSAERRYPPGCGRGVDAADDGSRFLTTAPARPGGGSTASPTKPVVDARHPPPSVGEAASGGVLEKAPAAVDGPRLVTAPASSDGGSAASRTKSAAAASRSVAEAGSSGVLKKASASVHGPGVVVTPARRGGGSAALPMKSSAPPPCSVGEAGSVAVLKKVPAAVVPRPIANAGRRGPHAAALKPLEPSCRSGVAAAADGLLDTHLQGVSDSGGFGNSKEVVRSLPKPGVMSAIRRFPPGCGRIRASQPLNNSADKCPETDSKDSSTASGSFGSKKKLIVKGPDHLQLEAKSADKCPETPSTASGSFGPKEKLIVKGPDHLRLEAKSADKCPKTESKDSSAASGSFEGLDHLRLDDVVDSILADDDFLKAEAAYQRKLELKLNGSSDARSKFKIFCGRFEFICRAIVQFVEQRSLKISRIDIGAGKVIKTLPGFTQQDPVIGNVPGVEVGDEFMYRVELALVGLHRPHQPGIDSIQDENGVLVAISIVASGGYPDELSSSGELIYTGSGGKYAGKKSDENQKLKGGNLALKNCIETKTPVRVIHGFKGSSREEGSHSRAKGASAFVYDGLYHVVDCWIEGQPGSKVFKYKLLRIPGQPELPHRSKIAPSRKTDIMC